MRRSRSPYSSAWPLNAAFDWWWADGVLALLIALLAAREGIEAWRGRDAPALIEFDPAD